VASGGGGDSDACARRERGGATRGAGDTRRGVALNCVRAALHFHDGFSYLRIDRSTTRRIYKIMVCKFERTQICGALCSETFFAAGTANELQSDGEGFEAAEAEVGHPLGRGGEAHFGEALDEAKDGDLSFEARELAADAEMRAGAEGQMLVVLAADVEHIGILELLGIAIGGAQHAKNRRLLEDADAADFDLFLGDARGVLNRTFEAQKFLDGGANQIGIIAQLLQFFGLAEKRVEAVADQVARGLVPGE